MFFAAMFWQRSLLLHDIWYDGLFDNNAVHCLKPLFASGMLENLFGILPHSPNEPTSPLLPGDVAIVIWVGIINSMADKILRHLLPSAAEMWSHLVLKENLVRDLQLF